MACATAAIARPSVTAIDGPQGCLWRKAGKNLGRDTQGDAGAGRCLGSGADGRKGWPVYPHGLGRRADCRDGSVCAGASQYTGNTTASATRRNGAGEAVSNQARATASNDTCNPVASGAGERCTALARQRVGRIGRKPGAAAAGICRRAWGYARRPRYAAAPEHPTVAARPRAYCTGPGHAAAGCF